jgi:hypothetical protein
VSLQTAVLIRPPAPSGSTLARYAKQERKTDSTRVSWELGPLQRKVSEEWQIWARRFQSVEVHGDITLAEEYSMEFFNGCSQVGFATVTKDDLPPICVLYASKMQDMGPQIRPCLVSVSGFVFWANGALLDEAPILSIPIFSLLFFCTDNHKSPLNSHHKSEKMFAARQAFNVCQRRAFSASTRQVSPPLVSCYGLSILKHQGLICTFLYH